MKRRHRLLGVALLLGYIPLSVLYLTFSDQLPAADWRSASRAPDGYWYGNRPELLADVRGTGVDELITRIEAAVPELRVDLPPSAVGKDCLGLRPVNALPIVGRLGPRRDNTPVRIETAEQYSRSIPYLAFKASFITLPPGWPASMLKVLSALRL